MIRGVLFACSLLCAASANAATVSITGTVVRVTGPAEFVDSVPIAVGDALRMTATMNTSPTADATTFGTFFFDAFTSLSGTVGGYSFSLSTLADAYRPIPVNRGFLKDDAEDRMEARASVAGDNVGEYQATLFRYQTRDDTATTLSDESFDPRYFDQSYLDELQALPATRAGIQYDAQAELSFRNDEPRQSGGNIFIDLKVTPPPPAPVPLPASGLLLLGGLAVAGFAFRRARPLTRPKNPTPSPSHVQSGPV